MPAVSLHVAPCPASPISPPLQARVARVADQRHRHVKHREGAGRAITFAAHPITLLSADTAQRPLLVTGGQDGTARLASIATFKVCPYDSLIICLYFSQRLIHFHPTTPTPTGAWLPRSLALRKGRREQQGRRWERWQRRQR